MTIPAVRRLARTLSARFASQQSPVTNTHPRSRMLVYSRMTANVLTATPETPLGEALRITHEQNIRHLPVLE
jgi:CBS domain-containing protein